jgi:folate-binding protein YgfZ
MGDCRATTSRAKAMNEWQSFLQSQTIQPSTPDNHLCALPGLGLLYVGGDDAASFLQNQLSNDINALDAGGCQFSSASTSKGRMYGIFRILKIEGGYILLMPRDILPEVHQRLHKYILMAKVVMANISDSFARFALSVTDSNRLQGIDLPTDSNGVSQSESLICLHLHGFDNNQRWLCLSNDENEAIALWRDLSRQLTINDESAFLHDEIRSGIPAVYTPTIESFVPQMANLDALDGINFKKGCYPGQEIVARTRYLGKLKRRMFLVECKTDICPKPGDELSADPSGKADGSGKVVHAAKSADNRCVMLFVGLIDKANNNELRLVAQPQIELTRLPMPYAVDA